MPHADGWDATLTQLRHLPRPALDSLVRTWLLRRGAHAVRPTDTRATARTYQALLPSISSALPVHVRVHQRANRLQAHHVDAFAGHLMRHGVSTGLLITTSGCTRDALAAAQTLTVPRIRLVSGPEWAAELAKQRAGLIRRCFWRWVVARGRRGRCV